MIKYGYCRFNLIVCIKGTPKYLKSLKHLKSTFIDKKDSANKLAMANSLWIQKGFKIYTKFREDTKSILNNAFHTDTIKGIIF